MVYGLDDHRNIQRLEREIEARLFTGFGQAETSEYVTHCFASDHPGAGGFPNLLTLIELMNDLGDKVPLVAEREIAVGGPGVFIVTGICLMKQHLLSAVGGIIGCIGKFDEKGC